MSAVPPLPVPGRGSAPLVTPYSRAPGALSRAGVLFRPAPRATVLVRAATAADLPLTAGLHVVHLPMGLFPQLGRGFVERWHRAHVDSPHGVALVALQRQPEGDRLVGFLIGATDRVALRHEMLTRHRRSLALRAAAALLVRPGLLVRFTRTRARAYLRRLRRAGAVNGSASSGAVGDLAAVVVDPACRRSGAGDALCAEFLAVCRRNRTPHVELVADAAADGPGAFYLRTGWRPADIGTTRDGVRMQRFVRELSEGRE